MSVGGRVILDGTKNEGISGIRVSMTDTTGATRSTVTGKSGKFQFDELDAGQVYIFVVSGNRFYAFNQTTTAHLAMENFDELIFIATPNFRATPSF